VSEDTLETIESLLEWVLENTHDEEVHYKVRTALQLLAVQENEIAGLQETVERDAELEQRLEELGYI
jgi:hypothetical protein